MTEGDLKYISRAAEFTYEAHKNQRRKYTGLPYFTHCYDVAKLVNKVTDNAEVISAAYLHDIVEDTDITIEEITDKFGPNVATIVNELTDKYTKESYPGLNRAERKVLEANRLKSVSEMAQTVKLADLIDNSISIFEFDKGFAQIYLEEVEVVLRNLKRGNSTLYDIVSRIINNEVTCNSLLIL